jgi:hypothetical protein
LLTQFDTEPNLPACPLNAGTPALDRLRLLYRHILTVNGKPNAGDMGRQGSIYPMGKLFPGRRRTERAFEPFFSPLPLPCPEIKLGRKIFDE